MAAHTNGLKLSEDDGGSWPFELPSIIQSLTESARNSPDSLAVACLHQPSNLYGINDDDNEAPYLRWTYSSLQVAVNRFASSLVQQGVKRGMSLATFLPNGVEYIIALLTAHKLGCPFVPVSPRTLVNAEEAAHMLHTAEASVIIVQDEQMAASYDNLERIDSGIKIIVSGSLLGSSWSAFSGLVTRDSTSSTLLETDTISLSGMDDPVAVLFTSGTTSFPKGCRHTSTTINEFFHKMLMAGNTHNKVLCSVLPNNHAMGYFFALYFLCRSSAVVFPSPGFDANAMLKALEAEKCTNSVLVPTTLNALLDAFRSRNTPPVLCLEDIWLGGASVTPDNLRQVVYELGSRGVSTGFGMTEGQPAWAPPVEDPEMLVDGDITLLGRVPPTMRVRVCAPESKIPVPRGERGVIHQSGRSVVDGYIGKEVGTDSFYKDADGRQWHITGDQGVMYEDGRIAITGRYKDMIIRGGENIAPASIELVLNRLPGVEANVVGTPDSIAGEVPIAVVRNLETTGIKELRDAVLHKMGAAFVPDEIMTLKDLRLDDFPKTTSGKIQKTKLASLVKDFRKQRDSNDSKTQSNKSLQDTVLRIWYKSSGIPVEHLDIQAPTTNFADSITIMRVRDSFRKELGFAMSLDDMVEHSNIAAQIKFMQQNMDQQNFGQQAVRRAPKKSTGAPLLEELAATFGSRREAAAMKDSITDSVRSKNFAWADVTAVIPTHDYMGVLHEAGIIKHWNFAIAFMVHRSNSQKLRQAMERMLSNHPMLTSFLVSDSKKTPYYVTIKQQQKLWDMCLVDHPKVNSLADVQQLAVRYPHTEKARVGGPLFHCILMDVEETKSAAMVMYVHHIVQDASYFRLVCEDLEQTLMKPHIPLQPHVDFKAWADSFQALRFSPTATLHVDYHVERLTGISKHKKGLYPAALVPRQATNEDPDGLDYGFDAPGLADLKETHPNIIAAVVLKAAMAIVAVSRTGHSHALYNNFEAGRTRYPFVPASVEALSPEAFEAADVGGPVMEGVCNLIAVPREVTGIALLERMQVEQLELTRHAHAPLRRVIDALNADGSGDGDMIMETQSTQFLTWVPGMLGQYERLTNVQVAIRCVAGLVVVAGLGGVDAITYMISMRWDVANFSREKTQVYLADLQEAILWLTNKEYWGVPVGVLVEQLSQKA